MPKIAKVAFIAPTHSGRTYIPQDVEAIISTINDIRRYRGRPDAVIAFVLSGGTSRLIAKFAEYTGVKAVLLVSHPGGNSLASALDARALLRELGCNAALIHIGDLRDTHICNIIANALRGIYNAKTALLNIDERPSNAGYFEDITKGQVVIFDQMAFEELLENAPDNYTHEFLNLVKSNVKGLKDNDVLFKIGRIYAAIRQLEEHGYALFAINCFPFLLSHGYTPCLALAVLNAKGTPTACEADLQALLLMAISKHVTGSVGLMANVNDVISPNEVLFSHCTASLALINDVKAVAHFESGYNYALTGSFKSEDVTIVSISRDFKYAVIAEGKVVGSGLLRNDVCRTQVVVRVSDAEALVEKAPYNHHVLMPGKASKAVKAVLELLGVKTEVLR